MEILIAGTRGIPASHGGFETFAQDLALFLVARGHDVTVYCQEDSGSGVREETWRGVRRVIIPAPDTPAGTIKFDWATVNHALKSRGVILTLGSNTGIFSYLYRLRGRPSAMNMDGIEWKREKWSPLQRMWLRMNEWAGAHASDRLVADHPGIQAHLERHTPSSKIAMIPYGADEIQAASPEPLRKFGLSGKDYYLVIARPEPENSLLDIVRGYSNSGLNERLVVLGKYSPETNAYHRSVVEASNEKVMFPGAIYDRSIVHSLRYHAKAYLHGHRVGGTNPSLVEALAAGNAIIAHDNHFTRWVAGPGAAYFGNSSQLSALLQAVNSDTQRLAAMEKASRQRHRKEFLQEKILAAYEQLLFDLCKSNKRMA